MQLNDLQAAASGKGQGAYNFDISMTSTCCVVSRLLGDVLPGMPFPSFGDSRNLLSSLR